MPAFLQQTPRLFRLTIAIVCICLLLGVGVRLVFRDDEQAAMRRGDGLFTEGRYYEAWQLYRRLAGNSNQPHALARLGMLQTIRGEVTAANQTFAQALERGLRGRDYGLLRLYQGRAALLNGGRDEAIGLWRTIDQASALFPYQQVLTAEAQLTTGDYAAAETNYRAALTANLPVEWQRRVLVRIAALRASSDIAGAQATLVQLPSAALSLPNADLLAPLLPPEAPAPEQLSAALRANNPERAIRLGQLYLDAGLYRLAQAQFAAVPEASALAQNAHAYAAYALLRAGDREGGVAELQALVLNEPDNARARALLALAYLDQTNSQQAQIQLANIRVLAPRSPDTHLAWGQWYAAHSDYLAAANEYRRALAEAPADQRATYALALARFHLDTTVEACVGGRPAAEQATKLADGASAWTALAEANLACEDYTAAASAAATALQHDPASAEAAFYQGRALAVLGQRDAARQALINAADLAPASGWRIKAENQLAAFRL